MDIKKFVKSNVRSLRAYEALEIPCTIKLDANESPYPGVRDQGSGASRKKIFQNLNRYPDPEAKTLRELIAKEHKVQRENVLHGNGSDELIYYLITTFGGPVLYPVPTFSMYGIISQALGEKRIEIPLDKDFDLDIEKILKAIKKNRPKLLFLSSPNNPTGNSFSSEKILRIIDVTSSLLNSHFSLVVVDEAYQAFSNKRSFLPLLKEYSNLVMLKTLSKIGMAGLRVGFLIADEKIIEEVNKVRLPFNVNSFSQAVSAAALKSRRLMQPHIKAIISERRRLFHEMKKMKDVMPFPSDANFILFKVKEPDKIYIGLLNKGILIRNMKGMIDGCLRVTVGTPGENRIFLQTLKHLL